MAKDYSNLAVPTIHLNGTGAESLLEAIETAYDAINTAIGALVQTAPNGRDYYVQSAGALELATEQHCWRISRLADIRNELEYLAIKINEQRRG